MNNWIACYESQIRYLHLFNHRVLSYSDKVYSWTYDYCGFCKHKWSTAFYTEHQCNECDMKFDLLNDIHELNKILGQKIGVVSTLEESFYEEKELLYKKIESQKSSFEKIDTELVKRLSDLSIDNYKTQKTNERREVRDKYRMIQNLCIQEGHPGYYCKECEVDPNH